MHPTKARLIVDNGLRCMLCGREFPYKALNWHHIKWKSISKENNEPIDNSYENGVLLCLSCHHLVHTYEYDSQEYKSLMCIAQSRRKPTVD